ncbi:MAG: DUF1513 domain-containing protein [Alphaproteobacteria bacterium]
MIHVDRRALLGAAGGGLLASLALRWAEVRGDAGPLYVACHADPEGRHFVAGFQTDGQLRFDLALPDRGHAMAFRERAAEVVVFARRPGRFAVVIDYEEGVALRRIDAPEGRHFYGHGAFSPDGRTLFATENDYASGDGMVGIYDATDGYRRIGEHRSHGIGPHELVLMPDGRTLAVANGGIRTHPDHDRAKLNLDTMTPSLVFTDLADGGLQGELRLPEPLHQLSIRHLALLADGRIAIAMQYEGGKRDRVPLVAIADGRGIATLSAPEPVQRRMRHYGGSVAVDPSGRMIAVSAPRGGLVTFWDGVERRYVGAADLEDGCGVAPGGQADRFLLTSGGGDVVEADARSGETIALRPQRLDQASFDNHLRVTPTPEPSSKPIVISSPQPR